MMTNISPEPNQALRHTGESPPPPINKDLLVSRCLGNLSFAQTLLSEFERSGQQHVEAILRSVNREDLQASAEAAHSLKGAAAILGAEPLRDLAAEIEAVSRAGDTASLGDVVDDLLAELNRCLNCIPTLLNSA